MTDLTGLGRLAPAVQLELDRMTRERWAERLWASDGTLWSTDPEVAAETTRWTGWLNVADVVRADLPRLQQLASDVIEAGFTHLVVAGMGGSSLCPDVLRETFPGHGSYPELHVLDSTDPATIARVQSAIDLRHTLFIISSKSGGTLETLSHYRYFRAQVEAVVDTDVGSHFIAITDDGSGLHKLATEGGFREVFLNPATIGGRYSALSYFGMVPAALAGVDVEGLLWSAHDMAGQCRRGEAGENPGLILGALLGAGAAAGRDKVSLVCDEPIATFGTWLEQLLAESTGKHGKGVVPVEGEPPGSVEDYGPDRVFVHLRVARAPGPASILAGSLVAAGHPVLTIDVPDTLRLGAEFLRWEVATAAAGALIGINPFDQPNVQESKDNTAAVLKRFLETGDFGTAGGGDIEAARGLLDSIRDGDYFAVLAYTEAGDEVEERLAELRIAVRSRFKVATTRGYGPRYLHSTGQLHKGGPNSGVYLILSDRREDDIRVPGEKYGFRTLITAQWVGDLKSLRDHDRRVAHVTLGEDRLASLDALVQLAGTAAYGG